LSGVHPKLVGRFWRVGVINHDGRHKATTGRARASSRASLAPT
jgi:ribosomal protein L36